MSQLTKYLTTGLASLYLALAPASADATSSYEHKFKNYKPQIRAEEPISNITNSILPDAIFVIPITPQRKPIPLELIMDLPIMNEVLVTPKPYKPQFLPTNLDKMPSKGKIK